MAEKPKTTEKAGPPAERAPRKPASPDIQALAKIDRILAELDEYVATRTLAFLCDKYSLAFTNLDLSRRPQLDKEFPLIVETPQRAMS